MKEYICEEIPAVTIDGKPISTMFYNTTRELVRCKDCKHRDPEDKKCDCWHDIRWQLPRKDDWFCADGERKDEQ